MKTIFKSYARHNRDLDSVDIISRIMNIAVFEEQIFDLLVSRICDSIMKELDLDRIKELFYQEPVLSKMSDRIAEELKSRLDVVLK